MPTTSAKELRGKKCRLSLRESTSFRGAKSDNPVSYFRAAPQHVFRTGIVLTSLLAICCTSGCATPGMLSLARWKHPIPKATRKNPAVKVLCLWQPGEGRGLDDMPTRGFTGQIYFFTRNGASPVVVNGDVRVFVFDDQRTDEEQSKPFHQFSFKGKAWQNFLTNSQIGPGYSLFIPYTREGHHHARCAMQVRLIADEGPTIYSEMVNITLTGTKKTADRSNDEDAKITNDRTKTRVDTIDLTGRGVRNTSRYSDAGRHRAERNSRAAVSEAATQEFAQNMRTLNRKPREFVPRNSQPIRDNLVRPIESDYSPRNEHPFETHRQYDGSFPVRQSENPPREAPRFRLDRSNQTTSAGFERTMPDVFRTYDNYRQERDEPDGNPIDSRYDHHRAPQASATTHSMHPLRSSDDGW